MNLVSHELTSVDQQAASFWCLPQTNNRKAVHAGPRLIAEMLSGIGDYGSSSGEEPEEDAAPTPKVKQEPVKSEHGGSAIAPTVKREPLIAKDGGKVQAVPAGAFSDSSSPSGSSDSSEDSDEADAGTAGRRIKEAPKMPKKRKLNLPPPDFNSTKLGSGGIYHQSVFVLAVFCRDI